MTSRARCYRVAVGYFRFRKTFRLMPGIRLNLSKSGVSTSIGRPGATLNVGGIRGARATVGFPGTGLSYTEHLGTSSVPSAASGQARDEVARTIVRSMIFAAAIVGALLLWLLA